MFETSNELTFDVRDEYNRKPIAEKVIQLITSDIQAFPMIINGYWGTGKTEFCHKTINLLAQTHKDYKAVYVDAFSADHGNEPIMTLLAAILAILPEDEQSSVIQKALPAIRFALKTSLKAGAHFLLRQNADDLTQEFQDAMKETSEAAINSTVESLLKDHVQSEKNLSTLKEALENIAIKQPLVIFIDELDRCKPSFAISIIESIKHVFNIKNVKFVLVTNVQQLQASINKIYGYSVDAKRYLDKFIGFTFTLPDTFQLNGQNNSFASIQHWKHCIQGNESLLMLDSSHSGYIKSLIEHNRLSLREVETFSRYLHIFQVINIDYPIGPRMIFGYGLYYILGIFLYCFRHDIAESFLENKVDVKKLANSIGLVDINYKDRKSINYFNLAFFGLLIENQDNEMSFMPEDSATEMEWKKYVNDFYNKGWLNSTNTEMVASAIKKLRLE